MFRGAAACAAVMLLGIVPLCVPAAETVRPLRTLTYAVELSIADQLETQTGGQSMSRPPAVVVKGRPVGSGRSTEVVGSGERRTGAAVATTGTITIDVLQATDDAGLIVAVTENATKRVRPKVTIGVASDGTLIYDPANAENVSDEEIAILHWLGRGFYGDHPTDVGTAWAVDQSTKGNSTIERYRVLGTQPPHRVTLSYALEANTSSSGGYTAVREGSLVYDRQMIVPVKVAFEGVARRHVGQAYDTLRTSVQMTLTADSFASR
jgi:hypothetical protein